MDEIWWIAGIISFITMFLYALIDQEDDPPNFPSSSYDI